MKNSEVLRKHFDELVEAMIKLDGENLKFRRDLYIYPNGEIEEFGDVIAFSRQNDNHIFVWSVNNEYNDFNEKENGCTYLEHCKANHEYYETGLKEIILWMEDVEEKIRRDEEEYYPGL